MIALLHCIVTSIEDDRLKHLIKTWKEGMNDNIMDFLQKLPPPPYFSVASSDGEEYEVYEDNEDIRNGGLIEYIKDFRENRYEDIYLINTEMILYYNYYDSDFKKHRKKIEVIQQKI